MNFLPAPSKKCLSCSTLTIRLPHSGSIFLTGSFDASGNLCLAIFFKVELNCKLEDVRSVVVLSLRNSSSGDFHNHLVCWLLLVSAFVARGASTV